MFHGVPHIVDDRTFSGEMKKISPVSGKKNVLLLHASLGKEYVMEEFGERIFPPEMKDVLKEFSYIALGHWHGFQHIKNYGHAWYSGSTERLSDREAGKDKGVVIVTLRDDFMEPDVNFKPIPVRRWYRFDLKKCGDRTVEEIAGQLRDTGNERDYAGAIVSVYLHDIKPEQSVYIKNSEVAEIFPGSLTVIVRRLLRHHSMNGIMHIEKTESLDVHFNSYLRGLVNDEREFGVLSKKAQIYFDKYERKE